MRKSGVNCNVWDMVLGCPKFEIIIFLNLILKNIYNFGIEKSMVTPRFQNTILIKKKLHRSDLISKISDDKKHVPYVTHKNNFLKMSPFCYD